MGNGSKRALKVQKSMAGLQAGGKMTYAQI